MLCRAGDDARLLLERGASPAVRSSVGATVLHYCAAADGAEGVVGAVLERLDPTDTATDGLVNFCNDGGFTALAISAQVCWVTRERCSWFPCRPS